MYSVEKDTLAYQLKSRPGTLYRDVSEVPLSRVVAAMNEYRQTVEADAVPEHDAIWFYMMNHAVAECQARFEADQPLGDFFGMVDTYQTMLSSKATRMFYYLLLITTRESRHLRYCQTKKDLAGKYGSSFANFQDALDGKGSSGAAGYLGSNPPDIKLGLYADALVEIFNEGKFSGGFGGKPWGEVAECMREFVYGRTSAELMLDTAFTLAHNNGPIFNKGMLYQMYSHELIKILDVQRSGQIPQLVANDETPYVQDDHREWQQKAEALIGNSFGGYVDWYLVEELGAVQSYGQQKQAQKDAHGLPQSHAKKAAEVEKAKLKKEMAAAAKKAKEEKEWFTVMPGIKVKKIERKVAA